jgi:hypothetical protein
MNLNIHKEVDVLRMLDINHFKKVLKPIKVSRNDEFLDTLIERSSLILSCLNKGLSIEDHQNVNIYCAVSCNIPLLFSARIGNGANCWISGIKMNGESLDIQSHHDKKELLEFLENIRLPSKIIFTTLELNQKIGKSESKFSLSI